MLPPFWQKKITLFNPVVYLISGFRWSFFGNADVPILTSLFALSFFTLICILIVAWIFKTGWRMVGTKVYLFSCLIDKHRLCIPYEI